METPRQTPSAHTYQSWEEDSIRPDLTDPLFLDHVVRYYFALNYLSPGSAVLDVACGKGYGTSLLATRAGKAVGIDLNQQSLATARRQFNRPNIDYLEWDVTRCHELGRKFDLIVAFEILEHIQPEQTERFLSGLAESLNPGGTCLISTPNHDVVLKSGVHIPDFHINNFKALEFRKAILRHFPNSDFLGQHRKKGALRNALIYIDFWNLRHSLSALARRIARARTDTGASTEGATGPASHVATIWHPEQGKPAELSSYRFSRALFRQSGLVMAVCRK
jgi:SAM-dependent methyltransferase